MCECWSSPGPSVMLSCLYRSIESSRAPASTPQSFYIDTSAAVHLIMIDVQRKHVTVNSAAPQSDPSRGMHSRQTATISITLQASHPEITYLSHVFGTYRPDWRRRVAAFASTSSLSWAGYACRYAAP
ncbi:hypothetical protein PENSPDRAFT_162564 [Peniophora sp. CONT]|nr:hypothetical protein PENSPDRAFT_162564 [Peniophora sp. CONT]